MSRITTHVLDTSTGKPAAGVQVLLETRGTDMRWAEVSCSTTDADGRCRDLLGPNVKLEARDYRLRFFVKPYFAARNIATFYPQVDVAFTITDPNQHFHVPLLLSPYGYSTYRGS